MFEQFRAVLEEQGADVSEFPQPDEETIRLMDAIEESITSIVDVESVVERKRAALAMHVSQIEESLWVRIPDAAFDAIFGEEAFIRVHDTTGVTVPETDLFAGLRRPSTLLPRREDD